MLAIANTAQAIDCSDSGRYRDGVLLRTYFGAERGRCARVARATGVSAAYLSQIADGVRPCPPAYAPAIEEACERQVLRWDLRPDDWHRIWPELIVVDGAPAVPVPAQLPAPAVQHQEAA